MDQSTTSGTTTYFIPEQHGNADRRARWLRPVSLFFTDNEGSVVAVISASGTVENRYAYDPYGQVTSSSGSVANPYGYAGGYNDSATGLVKFGTRYYNPSVGQFTQVDPSTERRIYLCRGTTR